MALLSWTSKNWTSFRWLEHMHCLACPFLSKNTSCEVILLSLQRSDLVSNQRYSLISAPCLPCRAKCTSLPQDRSVTWPSGLLDALSHTLGRWLSNTLAVTVLQRNPAHTEHGLAKQVLWISVSAYTIQKSVLKENHEAKNSSEFNPLFWMLNKRLIVFVGGWETPFPG